MGWIWLSVCLSACVSEWYHLNMPFCCVPAVSSLLQLIALCWVSDCLSVCLPVCLLACLSVSEWYHLTMPSSLVQSLHYCNGWFYFGWLRIFLSLLVQLSVTVSVCLSRFLSGLAQCITYRWWLHILLTFAVRLMLCTALLNVIFSVWLCGSFFFSFFSM